MAAETTGAFPAIAGYRPIRKLGEGGMGVVFLAEDLTLGRRVAVKLLRAATAGDAGSHARFLREARAMAMVEHPHLVRIYSYGECDGGVYLVMEYIEGENLHERIGRTGKLPIDEVLRLAREVAEGLEAASERGIVHRDIKPANVLIDVRGHAHVADFGLAKSLEAVTEDVGLTGAGVLIGTPHYLSPEQARGGAADVRSDIYSFGIVLYEMLAGARPFDGAAAVALVAHHLHTPLPPLCDKRPDAPPLLLALVEQMSDKDPARRPQSYAAIRQQLAAALAPVSAWTAGSPYRGLSAFDFDDAPIFCGRAEASQDVFEALSAHAAGGCAFVLVLGMSGSGKSSLVRAGVVPRLVQPGAVDGVALWRRAVVRPADTAGDLFDGLAAALMRPEAVPELGADGSSSRELAALLRENPKGAMPLVKGGLSQAAAEATRVRRLDGQPDLRLALVVDQMEELFTLERITAAERQAFLDAVSALARSGRVWVLATLRSDFYARCEELPVLMSLKAGLGQYHLLPPTAAEIGQMIRQPAQAAGLQFEIDPSTGASLDETLRDAATGHAGHLPLLEFALAELYARRTEDGCLTHAAYREIGGIAGALSRRAEEVLGSLPASVQASASDVFAALVRVGSDSEESFARRYAPLDALVSPDARGFVDAFVSARLFVADRADDGRAVVSIAHEALLQSWPRLRAWLEDNRELLRVRGRVATAAALWIEKGRPPDLLLPEGKALDETAPLLTAAGLSATERDFVAGSRQRAHQRARMRRFLNLSSAALLALSAAVYTLYLWKIVPTFVVMFSARHEELPLLVRFMIAASNWTVRLSPLFLIAILVAYRFRKRITPPEFIRSGMALAIATAAVLFLALLSFFFLLLWTAILLPSFFGR